MTANVVEPGISPMKRCDSISFSLLARRTG